MITGEIKNRIDSIWDTFWTGGINKYKEVERVKVEYEAPEVIFGKIATLQQDINNAMAEFKEKYL